ncbi:hypothetical protein JHK85_057679 [Glycine max]|nr:hypothetical protein JHK85_057679 [Glycine max]
MTEIVTASVITSSLIPPSQTLTLTLTNPKSLIPLSLGGHRSYPLLDYPSHAQPHLHAPTRHHFLSSSSSSPTTLPAADIATADYYPHASSFSDDSAKSNSKRASAAGSPYYNKKLKSTTDSVPATDYSKDREEWSDTAIACLLEAYTEKFNLLYRGNLRSRDWEEVAEAVGGRCGGEGKHQKSVEQCKNKIDNLKKRYKVELQKIGSGGIAGSSGAAAANSPSMARQTKNSWLFKACYAVRHWDGLLTISDKFVGRYAPSNATVAINLKLKPASNLKWHRVLFKISGSALAGNCQNIDPKVAIVVGGRNFFCGDAWVSATGLDRPMAYQIG